MLFIQIHRSLLVCGLAMAACTVASAQPIELVVDRTDGGVFFKNVDSVAATFDGYTLTSLDESLLIGAWSSVAGNYDASGDQSVDAVSDWFVLGVPDAVSLSEASLTEGSAALAPGQVVSLGLLFDTGKLEGLVGAVTGDGLVYDVFADYRDLTADYDGDLDIDQDDYAVWAATYGSTSDLRADGNGDNVVDAADYVVWRNSPHLVLEAAVAAGAIPEPASAASLLLAWGLSSTRRRRC